MLKRKKTCCLFLSFIFAGISFSQDSLYFVDETLYRLPVTSQPSTGLDIGDIDGDGDLDIVVSNACSSFGWGCLNRILINNGNGYFSDETYDRIPGLDLNTRGVSLCDVDNDDDLDILFANYQEYGYYLQNQLLINDGFGYFSDETIARLPEDIDATKHISCLDINGDNFLDLFIANHSINDDQLLINDGNGYFTSSNMFPGGTDTLTTNKYIATDVDGDFDLDLYQVNSYYSTNYQDDHVLLNNGYGAFYYSEQPVPNDPDDFSRTGEAYDLNGDHLQDIILAKGYHTSLYFNDGQGGFVDETEGRLPEMYNPIGMAVGDVSGDGYVDLFFGNTDSWDNYLLLNDGDNHFTDIAYYALPELSLSACRGAGFADFDNDGDLDLFIAAQADGINRIFINYGDQPDTTSPVIYFDPEHSVINGDQIRIFAQDEMIWLSSVLMHFRRVGDSTFTTIKMRDVGGDLYQSDLSLYHGIELEYYFQVMDRTGNETIYPEIGLLTIIPVQPDNATGDLNQDEAVDILDIIILVDIILNQIEPDDDLLLISDINGDGVTDVIDVVLLVDIILD